MLGSDSFSKILLIARLAIKTGSVFSFTVRTCETVNLFCVMVPVLSVHKTWILPRSSMDVKRLTTTPWLASFLALLERQKVVTTGKASGITPTVKAIAKIIKSTNDLVLFLIIK